MKQDKKGIILTIDAILALISATVLLSATFFYLSQTHTISWVETDLGQLGMDSLMTLELSGDLNRSAVDNDKSHFIEFCNVTLEPHVCSEIRLYNVTSASNYSLKLHYIDVNCILTNSTKSAISRRIFLAGEDQPFIAEMEVWYRS